MVVVVVVVVGGVWWGPARHGDEASYRDGEEGDECVYESMILVLKRMK